MYRSVSKILLSMGTLLACLSAPHVHAQFYTFSYTGLFTMLDANGQFIVNTDALANTTSGRRTDVSGLLTYDDVSGTGSFSVDPFNFAGGGAFTVQGADFIGIGDGVGNPGSLFLVNMSTSWNGQPGIPVSMVWDGFGFLNALVMGMVAGDQISGDNLITGTGTYSVGSVLPASDNTVGYSTSSPGPLTYPIGPTPLAMTTLNTTTNNGAGLGDYPTGYLPLIIDTVVDTTNGDVGIGGSPIIDGNLIGLNYNLDIGDAGTMVLLSVDPSPVPLPAAFWLFLSGAGLLLGRGSMTRAGRG